MKNNYYNDEEKVKKILNINSFREMKKEKIIELITMSNSLDKETYKKIIEQIPNFNNVLNEFLDGGKEIVKSSKELGDKEIETLNNISDSIKELLKDDKLTDNQKDKLIDLLCEIVKTIPEIGEKNRLQFLDMLKIFANCAGSIAMIMAAIVGVKFIKRR